MSNYFTAAEYAGGYDAVNTSIIKGANKIQITLYYQGTSREYIEFLRDEINGTAATLASPTPSGQANAYIAQTDPFFSKLKAWGNTIWDLWYHNHGLDGSGKSVAGIVPFQMTSATTENTYQKIIGDFEPDGDVDESDLGFLALHWLNENCSQSNECEGTDLYKDEMEIVNFYDFAVFAQHWLEGIVL